MRSTAENQAILDKFLYADTPISDYITIDQELGLMMLDYNIEPEKGVAGTNRRSSPISVNAHRDSIVKDEWLETTSGIGFATNRTMVDGAHRIKGLLKACQIDPTITIRQLVCGGLDPRSKRVIDTNRKRTNSQLLQMEGHVDVNRLAAGLRLVHCYYNVEYNYNAWDIKAPFGIEQQLEMVAKYPDIPEAISAGVRIYRKFKHFNPTAAAAAYFIGWHDGPEDVVDWFNDRLVDGLNLKETDPVYQLREFMRRNDGKHDRIIQLAYWLKAFNAHLAGSTEVAFSFKSTIDRFPYLRVPADWGQDSAEA